MFTNLSRSIGGVTTISAVGESCPSARVKEADLDCKPEFTFSGWPAGLKHAERSDIVSCEGGSTMRVSITTRGAALTVGKSHIDNGTGTFTDVHSINDVLGFCAQGEARADVVKSATAQVLTKGQVSLALAGTGEGVDIGINVGEFTLKRSER